MKSHYAPRTPLFRGDIEQLMQVHSGKKIAIISFDKKYEGEKIDCYTLSPEGDLAFAANQLFATLRKIDQANYDIILAAHFPATGIGLAINDRIERAQFLHK
jgi:L-threonylcarbamoyladenylate synthase